MEEEIDIRSELVRDFIDQVPNRLIQWGTTVIFVALFSILFISWLIHYPTIVVAGFRLTSENAPKPITVKNEGRLVKLFVKNNETVKEGHTLGFMEATAKHEEVLHLKNNLWELHHFVDNEQFENITVFSAGRFQHLGELQLAYQNFMQVYTPTVSLFAMGYFNHRKEQLKYELKNLEQNHGQLQEQHQMYKRDQELASKEFDINNKLYKEKVISPLDFQREESKYIGKQIVVKQLEVSITNNMTDQTQKAKEISDLERQAIEQKAQFVQALNSLISSVEDWQKKYIITATISGKVNFMSNLQENQALRAGTELMFIGGNDAHYFGEVLIPQANAGKVKNGQRVLVKLQGYPFEEYGAVEGIIQYISPIPTPDNQGFLAVVTLPRGLKTNANKQLTYKNGMQASAEIITEDIRLIERIFYQLKRTIDLKQ